MQCGADRARHRPSGAVATLLARLALALAAIFAVALAFAAPASAHATVVASSPEDGARLQSAPAVVSITFDESVGLGTLGYLNVTNTSGQRVDTGSAYHPDGDGTKIATKLKPNLPDGTYTQSYRVVSADSHPVAGVVRFVVGNGALVVSAAGLQAVNHATGVLFDGVRWASFLGIALLGGVWLLLTIWPAGNRDLRATRLVRGGWWLATIACIAELAIEGPYVAGLSLGQSSWQLFDATLHTDYGFWHCIRLILLGVAAVMLQRSFTRPRAIDDLLWLPLVGIALTFSAVGHAQTTNPTWVSIAGDMIHLCAMATWIGGLALLVGAIMPRRDSAELRAVLPTFSRVAFGCVVALAVTGFYAAWRGVGMWRAIFGSNYGVLVNIKIVLFIAMIALGFVSRRAINRRALDQPDGAVALERMRRSVLVELGLAALVLLATSILVDQPRGREAIAVKDARPVSGTANLLDGETATVRIDPGKHGTVTVTVELSSGVHATKVTGTATQNAAHLGPLPLPLTANGSGLYAADGVSLPIAGDWTIALVVTTSVADAVSTDVTLALH